MKIIDSVQGKSADFQENNQPLISFSGAQVYYNIKLCEALKMTDKSKCLFSSDDGMLYFGIIPETISTPFSGYSMWYGYKKKRRHLMSTIPKGKDVEFKSGRYLVDLENPEHYKGIDFFPLEMIDK